MGYVYSSLDHSWDPNFKYPKEWPWPKDYRYPRNWPPPPKYYPHSLPWTFRQLREFYFFSFFFFIVVFILSLDDPSFCCKVAYFMYYLHFPILASMFAELGDYIMKFFVATWGNYSWSHDNGYRYGKIFRVVCIILFFTFFSYYNLGEVIYRKYLDTCFLNKL